MLVALCELHAYVEGVVTKTAPLEHVADLLSQIAFGVLEVVKTYLVWNRTVKLQKEKGYEYIVYIAT